MSSFENIKKQILAEIKKANHIMLVAHQKPDGDAAGACLAMAHYLEDLNKEFTCFCIGELSPNLHYLPKKEHFNADESHWKNPKFDLLIVLDSGDLRYAGIDQHVMNLTHDYKIINIDHHPTNEYYGDYNLVVHDASSTCEIVHGLLDSVKALNKQIATCLLTGIVTDTGGFSNMATTASSIAAASKLLLHGANLKEITKTALDEKPVDALRLWGRALERLYKDKKTGIIITAITYQDLVEYGGDSAAVEGISNFLNTLEEARSSTIMVLAEREPGFIKASLRTTSSLIDVSKFAKLMGGGGHKKAAGFSIKGSLIKQNHGFKIIPSE